MSDKAGIIGYAARRHIRRDAITADRHTVLRARQSTDGGAQPGNRRVRVVGQSSNSHRLEEGAGILTLHSAHLQTGHAADVYYLLTHVAIEVLVPHPVYAAAVEKMGPAAAARSEWADQKTERFQIQFGPAGGFGNTLSQAILVLLGYPIRGAVNIQNLSQNPVGTIQHALSIGRGYEFNLPEFPSVFPDPLQFARRWLNGSPAQNLANAVEDRSAGLANLDPARGQAILQGACRVQELCDQGEYLYLVYDRLDPPPWVAENVFTPKFKGKRLRNCWGFVTDVFDGW